jgi:hypothetical protein
MCSRCHADMRPWGSAGDQIGPDQQSIAHARMAYISARGCHVQNHGVLTVAELYNVEKAPMI